MELLVDVGIAGQVERQTPLEVGNRVIDIALVEEQLHDGRPALNDSHVERGVSIFVSSVNIRGADACRDNVLDNGELGALNGQVQDSCVLESGRSC